MRTTIGRSIWPVINILLIVIGFGVPWLMLWLHVTACNAVKWVRRCGKAI